MKSIASKLKVRFDKIYKGKYDASLLSELEDYIEKVKSTANFPDEKWSEKDVVLITYGDSILSDKTVPLKALKTFLQNHIGDAISFVHILPFFPYSSDDGFSVIDYKQVNPELGNWDDVKSLSSDYKLMFDLVINHISQHSAWFKNYKLGKSPGKNYFIEADPKEDLTQVVRPRSLPLLTPVNTPEGEKHVWTTFSDDQIDLNFGEPELMAEMIKVFLYYLQQGSSMIRLDAIAFLWKEIGTNCLHLPETHEFVKILRDICDYISPGLILLTETNVPNKENISYFGNNDEANMVYQFSLPPLLLHALHNGNSEYLTKWAKTIPSLSPELTFFNFTASHDGIGMRPLEGLVPHSEIIHLVDGMKSFGAKVNTRRNSDGTDSPYEINITYFDALKGTQNGLDQNQEERFICSQTIMMTMAGVPAFYIHSLLATKNYTKGVEETGMNRTINRRKWHETELQEQLNTNSHHSRVLKELTRRIAIRKTLKCLAPSAKQGILELGNKFFCVVRGENELFAIFNVSTSPQEITLNSLVSDNYPLIDLLSIPNKRLSGSDTLELLPYQSVWLIVQK